jgi:hypothetical protein
MWAQIGWAFLLWLTLTVIFYALLSVLFDWLEKKMRLWRKSRKQRVDATDELLNIGGGLLGSLHDLHTDSLAARQALIRESFAASRLAEADPGHRPSDQPTDNIIDIEATEVNK